MTPKQIINLVVTVTAIAGAVAAAVLAPEGTRDTIVAALLGLVAGGQAVPRLRER